MSEICFDKLGRLRHKKSIFFYIAAVAIFCLLIPCTATPIAADTYLVNTTADIVNKTPDSSTGSLRSGIDWAFLSGDTITFDPAVFPPANPATINLLSGLPDIAAVEGITIDASNAGVILDGSKTQQGTPGLRLTLGASNNTIKGLQIVHFPGSGIEIINGAKNNQIGGNWQIGSALRGEGNIITMNNGDGVNINGTGTNNNIISGNLIGLDIDGTRDIRAQALTISPNYTADKTLFIGTKFNGVYKTTDGGATWQEASSGLTIMDVRTLVISPDFANDQTVFAGTAGGGIFKTTDRGVKWTRVDGGITTSDIRFLAISPNYSSYGFIFAVSNDGGGVFASIDKGTTWALRNSGLTNNCWISGLFFSPNIGADRTIYAFDRNTLYKSSIDPADWTVVSSIDSYNGFMTITASPNFGTDHTLLAGLDCGSRNHTLRSTDSGINWTPFGDRNIDGCNVNTIIYSPVYASDNVVFAASDWTLKKSYDGGKTWQRLSWIYNSPRYILAISPSYASDKTVFTGQVMGSVFKSVNSGDTWESASAGLTEPGNSSSGVRISNNAKGNVIGGNSPGKRNVISHNSNGGVAIHDNGSDNNMIIGNYIGTDASGAATLGNSSRGVSLSSNAKGNLIGGNAPGERNIISGNWDWGVSFDNSATNNTVAGNYIGLNAAGTAALGNMSGGIGSWNGPQQNKIVGNVVSGNNSDGIHFNNAHRNLIVGNYVGTDPTGETGIPNIGQGISFCCGAQGNVVGGTAPGQANVIAYNRYSGINVSSVNSVGNTLSRNVIFSHTSQGIDNNGGGNNEFPPPVLTNIVATSVTGISASPNLTIEIFSDNADEGRIYEGTSISDGSGAFTLSKPGGFQGPYLTATSTDADGNTSELSSPRPAAKPATPYVLTVNKSGSGSGSVTSTQPILITCGEICSGILTSGTTVTLTVAADDGSVFSDWTGACTGTQNTCTVTMSASQTVTAQFIPAQRLLTISKTGIGSGTVTSSPTGIYCGDDCSKIYNSGSVELTATPATDSNFGGWSGACSGSATTCLIEAAALDASNLHVIAAFASADITPPASLGNLQATPTINAITNDNTIYVSWTAAPDTGSGLAGYSFAWDTNPNTDPDNTVDTTRTSTTSWTLPNGPNNWFHIRAVDIAGNAGPTVHLGPFNIDTTSTPPPQRAPKTMTVTSRLDSGPGSLRQAMLDAILGDIITFDPAVFPTASPATINPISTLPEISMGGLTIDASKAGVILDGRWITSGASGLRILSNGNTIKGLQIIRFPGSGIEITGGAKNNKIGGVGQMGGTPRGEGNIITLNNSDGISINGIGTDNNIVSGNLIGLDIDGTRDIRTQALAISTNYGSDKTLFIGTKFHGVMKSTDGGATWQEANSGLTIMDVRALAIANDGTIFAGTASGGIFKTTNGGAGWTRVDGGITTADIASLTISPIYATLKHIYANTGGNGIFASLDGGTSWSVRNSGLNNNWVNSLLISPSYGVGNSGRDRTLFAYTWDTLFKSVNQGSTWTVVLNSADLNNINTMAISPNFANDNTLLAGYNCNSPNLLSKSTDGGVTWTPLGDNKTMGCHTYAIGFSPNYATDKTVLAGTHWDFFKSGDSGATWTGSKTGNIFGNYNGNLMKVSPTFNADQTLFIGRDTGGVFKSVSGGGGWEDLSAGLAEQGNSGSGVSIFNSAQGNVIGGDSPEKRNVISHNSGTGVTIHQIGTSNNVIIGNYIGTNSQGTLTLGNQDGVGISNGARNNRVGGTTATERNLISGNKGNGIGFWNPDTKSNTISGNYIGTDYTGTAALGNNAQGVGFWDRSQQNTVSGNLISGNQGSGVHFNSDNNTVTGNIIGLNASGTVILANNGNGVDVWSGSQNKIGGATAAERNILSGNRNSGVHFWNADSKNNNVIGNFIGTDPTGTVALGNSGQGVVLGNDAQLNTISGNVISGNLGDGVHFNGGDSNTVTGNYIGTDATGAVALGNGSQGINIFNNANQNVIGGTAPGKANVIANNRVNGIGVTWGPSINNTISHNAIFNHPNLGIDNNSGGNKELAPPVLNLVTDATYITGTALANVTIEIFSDDVDEGRIYEGTATSDGSGKFSFTKSEGFQGPYLTTTATDANGNTSEFSSPRAVAKGATQSLTVNKSGSGTGTVTSTQPVLIACGAICSGTFNDGIVVTLAAAADSGSRFDGWTGCTTTTTDACTVTMSAAKKVTAVFNTLSADTASPTNATIVINAGATFTENRQVTLNLSAADASGMGQMKFSNDNLAWTDPLTFAGTHTWNLSELDGQKTVYAKFSDTSGNWMIDPIWSSILLSTSGTVKYSLTTAKTGAGAITSNPTGISCGNTCSIDFLSGQSVTLTPTPDAGNTFTGWSGDCSGTGTCTLVMYGNRSVTATFKAATADKTPPIPANPGIVINSGADSTGSRQVTLTLSASDSSGMGQMRFSNDDKQTWFPAVPFATATFWTLAAGDGEKKVWAKFSDSLNNWMSDVDAVSDTIMYTAPAAGELANPTGLVVAEAGTGSVSLKWNKNDEVDVTYNLFRSQTVNGIFYRVNSAPIGEESFTYDPFLRAFYVNYTDAGLKEGQTYFYKIQAFFSGATSQGFSNVVSAKPPTIDDYVVNVFDPSNIVNIGNSVKYNIQLLPRDKFRGKLSLSCSKMPVGIQYEFIVNGEYRGSNVTDLIPPAFVMLEVTPDSTTQIKEHTFSLLAQNVWTGGGSDQRATPLTLTVLSSVDAGIHVEVEKTNLRKGEKVRIFGSILPIPTVAQVRPVILTLTKAGGSAETKNVPILLGGKFSDADWISTLSTGNYTITASWTDSQTETHVSTARSFTVGKGQPVLTCLRNTGMQAAMGSDFKILGSMKPVVPYAPLTLLIENPEGVAEQPITIVLDEYGQFSRLDKFFTRIGIWKFRVYYAGNEEYIGAESNELVVPVGVDFGRAIILGGGDASQSNTYWEVTKKLTVSTYRDFKAKGFNKEMIYYLINTSDIDINYDGKSDNVVNVTVPTSAAFIETVEHQFASVLNLDTPLFIYLQGHGTSDGRLQISGTKDYLTATLLKDALDYLQGAGKFAGREGAVTANVVIIIEACYSGSFIPSLSGKNRVILTSAGNEPYNTDSTGQIAFSRRLFSKLMEGDNFKKAFEYARQMQINMNYPAPLLDDNGDGASNTSDGLLASSIYLNGQLTWGLKPTIGPIVLTPILENGISTPILALVIKGDVNIEKVWVHVIAPNANIGGGEDTITYPEVVLTKNEATGLYEGVLNDLRISGIYKLVILASDANKEIADPVITYITVSKNAKPGDINGDESITIADAILAMQVLARMRPEGLPAAALSDVNRDGKTGMAEVIYIMQTLAGMR